MAQARNAELIDHISLPHSIESEMTILGSMMIDNSTISLVVDLMGDGQAFYSDDNVRIYRTIVDMHNNGIAIEPSALMAHLRLRDSLERVGGMPYLAKLEASVISADNVEPHVRIVLERAARCELVRQCVQLIENASSPMHSLDDLTAPVERSLARVAKGSQRAETWERLGDIVRHEVDEIGECVRGNRVRYGLKTGIPEFDNATGGLEKGDYMILAARPSTGKTALAKQIEIEWGKVALANNSAVAMISMDSSKKSLAQRSLAAVGDVHMTHIQRAKLTSEELDSIVAAAMNIARLPIFVDSTSGTNVERLVSRLRRLASEHNGLTAIIVDYIQQVGARGNDFERVSNVSRALKDFAKEIGAPLLALSQLSRNKESEFARPSLSDLRSSGQLEQDADIVVFLHRESDDQAGPVCATGAKYKNGPKSEWKMKFDGTRQRFTRWTLADQREYEGRKGGGTQKATTTSAARRGGANGYSRGGQLDF
jgi:replicative DNA helicase